MDPITPICERVRRLIAALVLLAPLGACSQLRDAVGLGPQPTGVSHDVPRVQRFAPSTAQALYGSYLSARIAGSERDTKTAAQFYARALALDPQNEVILDQAFLHELASGEMKKAVMRAREIVSRDKDKRLAQLVVALDDIKHSAYDDARARLKDAAVGPFNELASGLITAWTFEAQGKSDAAVAALSKGGEPSAFQLYYLMHKALILDQAGGGQPAEDSYRDVITTGGGDSLRVVQGYGQLLEREGRGQEAISLYKAFTGDAPMHPLLEAGIKRVARGEIPPPMIATPQAGIAEVLYGLASALAQERSIDLPIVYLHLALYADPSCDLAWLLLGDILDAVGRYDEANAAYDGVSKSSPLRLGAEVNRAMNYEAMGQGDKAVARLKELAEQDGGNLRALVSLGDLLRNHERYSEAAQAYTRALALAPQNEPRFWSLYFARGVAYERAGQWPAAEADLKQALTLSPGEPSVLNYLGYSWIEQAKNLDSALKMIEEAVEARPDDGFIVDSLGWAQFKLGRFKSAVETLQHAVGLQPQDATINAHLGDAYWKVGRTIEARFQWKRALSLGASGDEAVSLQDKIDFGLEGPELKKTEKDTSRHAG